MKSLSIKAIILFVLCSTPQLGYSQLFGGLTLHRSGGNIVLSSISPYYVYSTYDTDYLPYVAPTGPATLVTPVAADGTLDRLIDIQGVITTTGVTVSIPYTVTISSVTLPAFTQTITIPSGSTEDGISRDLTFSYPATGSLPVGTGTITATLQAVGGTLNAKKLDVQTGIGNDNLGYLLGQFTYATNSSGGTANFAVRDMANMCGAFVAANVFKAFMCYNLGSTDTTSDPNIPIQGNNGDYYQWGKKVASGTPTAVTGTWNTIYGANGSWADTGTKTANDPCPVGYRVPTNAQWVGVIANNTASYTAAAWTSSATNWGSAIHFGPNTSTYTLTLPATGVRGITDGTLAHRGYAGRYWSSTENGSDAYYLFFSSGSVSPVYFGRTFGISVRCVSE
jgi:uncharacterized protein (TIGR02145 family)